MNLNPLAGRIFSVIESKGFHDIQHSQQESLTFRQLLHLVAEWNEMLEHYQAVHLPGSDTQQELAGLYEEGADILIVALDLAALHRVDLSAVAIEKPVYGGLDFLFLRIPRLIGRLGDIYRKERRLDKRLLSQIIHTTSGILKRHGANPLEEVEVKMKKNAARPQRYGTAEVEE